MSECNCHKEKEFRCTKCTSETVDVDAELTKLITDIYSEGYQCGKLDEDILLIYINAAKKIVAGERYTNELLNDCLAENKL